MTPQNQQLTLSEYYLNLKKKEFGLEFYQQPKETEDYRSIDLSEMWILKYEKGGFWGTNYNTKEECWRGNVLEISKNFDFLNNLVLKEKT